MLVGDLADDGETEARSGRAPRALGPPEAIEHEGDVLGCDARAVVAHGDLAVVHRDVDLTAGRAPLAGVVEQVADGAFDPVTGTADHARREVGRSRARGALAIEGQQLA